jgi:CheY-like chemotaxis protein
VTRPRLLLIDDDDDIREIAAVTFATLAGWEVLTAASGRTGVERAVRERPDAILLDVMMPEMDGPTTYGRLRADPRTATIPVVLLTAKAADDGDGLGALGAAGILRKPFDPFTLPAQVAALVGWRS